MAKNIYSRLALNNLKRNKQFYMPYFIASAIMSAMFICIMNILFSNSLNNVREGSTMQAVLYIGLIIMSFFTFGYMLYLNSFLMKRRKKEFGLYAVLGLEKKHVVGIIMREMFLLNIASFLTGVILATVFGKLIFMLLMAVMKVSEGSAFNLSLLAYVLSAVYFIVIYTVGAVYNAMQVRLANPIDLINGEKKGEKKLKGVVPITILGALCLGCAYYLAITVKMSAIAITGFWPAVLLVIIGTYCLFAAGCQFVLKRLKNNEKFYYKPQNFISVSDLMYRMKQNSSGLANICILSTMVLVTISMCCSLYFGQEKILAVHNPHDIEYTLVYNNEEAKPDRNVLKSIVEEKAEKYGAEIDNIFSYYALRDSVLLRNGEFVFKNEEAELVYSDVTDYNSMHSLYIITAQDYSNITGENLILGSNEVIILTDKHIEDTHVLETPGGSYSILGIYTDSVFTKGGNGITKNNIFFVSADKASAEALRRSVNPGCDVDKYYDANDRRLVTQIDFTAPKDSRFSLASEICGDLYKEMKEQTGITAYYDYTSIDIDRQNGFSLYGGLLFLGVFFTILFLINTIVIMYFKQVSEGYEDKDRFVIMQKVGLSDSEVKKIINRQTLILFFLPLTVALVHILAACNMMVKMLEAFVMTDTTFALMWILISAVVFSIIYVIVYKVTAKAYYRIVKW